MEGCQCEGIGGRIGGNVQGLRNTVGRYRIDRGVLGIVWEVEKPKNA